WAGRLAELEARAHSVRELAQALVEEDPGAQTVLVWADALRTTIESHTRDLDIMRPLDGHVAALPTLADTPDLVQSLGRSATASGALIRRLTIRARDAAPIVDA